MATSMKKRRLMEAGELGVEDETEESVGEESDEDESENDGRVNAVFFVCGRHPFKTELNVPRRQILKKKEVLKYARRQNIQFPKLSNGHFEDAFIETQPPIYFFKFKEVTGCRDTKSKIHNSVLSHELKSTALPVPRPNEQGVGGVYLFNEDMKYELEGENLPNTTDGSLRIKCNLKYSSQPKRSEGERTEVLVTKLKTLVPDRINVTRVSGDAHNYCPFTGGGDVFLYSTKNIAACLQLSPGIENVSPKKEGELRMSAIECKGIQLSQSKASILMQLQANMLLCSTVQLIEKLRVSPEEAKDVKTLTCLGLALGVVDPLMVVKMTIDFSKRNLRYELLTTCEVSPFHYVYVDGAIAYILRRMDND